MKRASQLLGVFFASVAFAVYPAEGPDKKTAPAPEGGGPPPQVTEKYRPSRSPNLEIPTDLPEKTRKAVEEGVAAFHESEKAESDRKLLAKAIDKLSMASQKASKSPLPLYYLGIVYQKKKNYTEARRVLEKAVKLNPRFHEALVELGDVYCWQKDLKGSLAIYERALEISPSYLLGVTNKAYALIRLGLFKEAKIYLEQAQKIEKNESLKAMCLMIDAEIKGPPWPKTFTVESENYQVLTSISQEFAQEISRNAELIHRAYDKVFSDVTKPDRKFPIWVYEDREAYMKGGGPPMAGGHYDPRFRKLVLFKYPKKEDTILVLNHEALHQYLHDYLEDAPQWFNEGLGDYFGAYQYFRKGAEEKMMPRPNPKRLYYVQGAIDSKLCPPASSLMVMSQREMYEPRMMGVHYAQAWGMIYFIFEGNKPQYRSVLMNYFKVLHKGMDTTQAYEATFGKLDMERFDKEWKGFIRGLNMKMN